MLTVGCWSASCLYGADCYVIISCEADHAVVRLHQVTAGHEPEGDGIDILQNVLVIGLHSKPFSKCRDSQEDLSNCLTLLTFYRLQPLLQTLGC